MIRLKKLVVRKFRIFKPDSVFEIGPTVTLISGLNGTAKSTLLGMLCQPLGFTTKKSRSAYIREYDECGDLGEKKTLFRSQFKAQYSDVFRMSKEFDKAREHEYTLFLEGDAFDSASSVAADGLNVRSEKRKDQQSNNLRFVTNSELRDAGNGNFPHPVVYLGLERLRPLATSEYVLLNTNTDLTEEEKSIWTDIYRKVLQVHPSETVGVEELDTKGFKRSYKTIRSDYFDGESASAGQDNLVQIITAIISFYRLKKELGVSYQGGVLLIDEFDATLHPASQVLLLRVLASYAEDLQLQIISTTHSMTALEVACRELRKSVKVIYLQRTDAGVELRNDVDFSFIQKDLAHVLPSRGLHPDRITVLFEDAVAANFFRQVTQNVFGKFIAIYNAEDRNNDTALPNDVIKNIALRLSSKEIPDFSKVVYVLDPDSHHLLQKRIKRLLALPGKMAIEKELYLYLFASKKTDPLWGKAGYSWDICFDSGYHDIEHDPHLTRDDERLKQYKKWFREKIVKPGRFGRGGMRAFQLWRISHMAECKAFSENVLAALGAADSAFINPVRRTLQAAIEKKFKMPM